MCQNDYLVLVKGRERCSCRSDARDPVKRTAKPLKSFVEFLQKLCIYEGNHFQTW